MKIIANVLTGRKAKRSIGKILTLLLLVLYVAGTSQLELLHSFVHDHAVSVSHSEEQGADSCHSVIDYVTKPGCDHDSHLIVSDKCDMCDLAYNSDQAFVTRRLSVKVEYSTAPFDFYKRSVDSFWAVMSSSRAPPALV